MVKTIKFNAKCSDCFDMVMTKTNKVEIQYDGYPPIFLGGGDYIRLEIDIATGKILNWNELEVNKELEELVQLVEEE